LANRPTCLRTVVVLLAFATRTEAVAGSSLVLDVTPWQSEIRSTLRLEAGGCVERWDFAAGEIHGTGSARLAEGEARRLFALAKEVPPASEPGDRDGDVLLLARNGEVAVYRGPDAPPALEKLRAALTAATAQVEPPREGASWVRAEPVAASREQQLHAAGVEAIPLGDFGPEGREALAAAAAEPWAFLVLSDAALGEIVARTDSDEFYVLLGDPGWIQASLWGSP
jgi:hypothetical protein